MKRRIALAVLAASGVPALAGETLPPAAAAGLPAVPTLKILAIGHLTPKWTPQSGSAVMPDEVRATVELYLAGRIDQWYVRKDQPGVVFLVNARDIAEARDLLEALPLGREGLMTFDYIPLGPLAPLRALVGRPPH